jgi:hypothetical protein
MMRELELDLNEIVELRNKGTSIKVWAKSQLEKAGFNLDKDIIALVDITGRKYKFIQEDSPKVTIIGDEQ